MGEQLFPERNAEIVRRRKAGEWPTQIAKAMGLSRNTVIGVTNRAGLARADVDKSAVMRLFTPRGDNHPQAKLSAASVAAMRAEWIPGKHGFGSGALGKRYGVSASVAKAALTGKTWAHVAGRAVLRASPTPDDATRSAPARSGGMNP